MTVKIMIFILFYVDITDTFNVAEMIEILLHSESLRFTIGIVM